MLGLQCRDGGTSTCWMVVQCMCIQNNDNLASASTASLLLLVSRPLWGMNVSRAPSCTPHLVSSSLAVYCTRESPIALNKCVLNVILRVVSLAHLGSPVPPTRPILVIGFGVTGADRGSGCPSPHTLSRASHPVQMTPLTLP